MYIIAKVSLNYTVQTSLSSIKLIKFLKDNFDCDIAFSSSIKKITTIEHIKDVVIKYFDITEELFDSKCRKKELVQARQLAMYFSLKFTNKTLNYIGMQIGKRNHATVLYAKKTVNNHIETEKYFKSLVETLEKKI